MTLSVGIPSEIKDHESRVAITPDGVTDLVRRGARVLIQSGAGVGSAIEDHSFADAGAQILPTAADIWSQADLVCKVKEPQPSEFGYLRENLILFTYLHLAAHPTVAEELVNRGTTAIAYETVQLPDGSLPLLQPMSEVAGRMATQIGAHYLEDTYGGRGVLMGGAPGVRPARVVVLGAGNVGWNAAWIAAGMQAKVSLMDKNPDRLRWADQIHMGRITTLASNLGAVERAVAGADLLIGAVLIAGEHAPMVVTEEMVETMMPGSVIVDVAVDQGGCIETTRETTHSDPVYKKHGVLHYAVGNIPGAVPHTSTYALSNATLPYLALLATEGLGALESDAALAGGLNTRSGALIHPAVRDALNA